MMRVRAEIIEPQIAAHRGRLVKDTGEDFLAMFDNALGATQCAIALQREISSVAGNEPANCRIYFRMGVNVAEGIIEGDDIYGDGVNVAARLQTSNRAASSFQM
jgi:adenylate cyclase